MALAEKQSAKKEVDRARNNIRVNMVVAFERQQEPWDLRGLKSAAEVVECLDDLQSLR